MMVAPAYMREYMGIGFLPPSISEKELSWHGNSWLIKVFREGEKLGRIIYSNQ